MCGSSGWIGQEFQKQLKINNIEVVPFSSREFNKSVYDFNSLELIIRKSFPDVVINCSGYTGKPNVDACEDHKSDAINSNIIFVKMLAEVCELNDIPLGHISSGCIYNGYDKEYTEEDRPNFTFESPPCSFYSGTKAMAEDIVNKIHKKWIWRLRIPFESKDGPRNYITKMLKYDTLLNVRNSLSQKQDYVKACIEIILKEKPFGIYNITNPGSMTTEEVVEMIKLKLNVKKTFKYFESLDSFNKIVKTPRSNCVLNTDKLINSGIIVRPIKEAMEDTLNNWIY